MAGATHDQSNARFSMQLVPRVIVNPRIPRVIINATRQIGVNKMVVETHQAGDLACILHHIHVCTITLKVSNGRNTD